MRSIEEKRVHAAQQRKYRLQAKQRRERAIGQLCSAAVVLREAGMSPGEILDTILAVAWSDMKSEEE